MDAFFLTDVVERAYVGVVQSGDRFGFAFEALPGFSLVGQILGKYLDRDRAIEARVIGPVDLAL